MDGAAEAAMKRVAFTFLWLIMLGLVAIQLWLPARPSKICKGLGTFCKVSGIAKRRIPC